MANYVSVKKVLTFPRVINAYPKAAKLWKMIKARTFGRVPPNGAAVPRQNAQIDVEAITGVPAMRKNGRKK